jgi:RNA polymerase sigma factor (sigma-70 family)
LAHRHHYEPGEVVELRGGLHPQLLSEGLRELLLSQELRSAVSPRQSEARKGPRLSPSCAQIVTDTQPIERERCGTIVVGKWNGCQLTRLSGCRSRYSVVLDAATVHRGRLPPNAALCAAARRGKTNRGVRFRRLIAALRVQRTASSFRSAVKAKQSPRSGAHATVAARSFARRGAVDKALRTLPEREQRLIELRFGFDGEQHSLATAGRKLGITRERARQLEREALTKLASALSTADVGETERESAGLPSAA